jgi:RHH-type rel operon transcriptional repressor/antitoxin RelB
MEHRIRARLSASKRKIAPVAPKIVTGVSRICIRSATLTRPQGAGGPMSPGQNVVFCLRKHQTYSIIIHCMGTSNILTLRIDSGLKKRLDKLAKSTQRSRSFLAAEAIQEYVALNEWQIEEIKRGIREADAGNFATAEEVAAMRKKWKRRAR